MRWEADRCACASVRARTSVSTRTRACVCVSKRRKGRSDEATRGGVGLRMARQGKEIGRKEGEEQKMEAWMERCWLGRGGGGWRRVVASESKNRKPFMSVWMAGQRPLPVMCRRTSLHSQERCFILSVFSLFFFAHGEQSG